MFLLPSFNGGNKVICSDICIKGAKLADMEYVERIPSSAEPPIEVSYPSVDEELVGFDDHARNIIKKLRGRGSDLDVISIVGMAGIGKTALARKIYGDVSIIGHFDVRAWCSVGQTYNVRKLFLEILKQITGDRFVNVDDPYDMVRKNLFRKKGSRIMVATRNVELTRYMSWRSDPYLLPLLRDEESWELLEKKVFRGESCPLELRSVGTLIAKQCKGLPFLIIMIAGFLSRKEREASTWLEVAYDIGSHAL
ncbi:hypothetical protein CQW23_30625 [Capsicum baccatum]|uniref:NB-ARC domain-containing protein n=1 Tax=Capsicum baccatum TaxID=33114 RepID=A0A2G2V9W9_CAPBA|nr:hypothetical protein CQW23_30625 [Capsicum baccatum]